MAGLKPKVKGKKQTLTWRSAKTSRPDKMDLYLVCTKNGKPREARYEPFLKEWKLRWGDKLFSVIWWMPMPTKPVVGD